eukprot:354857-Chlamydomonas_euryale.AAC.29
MLRCCGFVRPYGLGRGARPSTGLRRLQPLDRTSARPQPTPHSRTDSLRQTPGQGMQCLSMYS